MNLRKDHYRLLCFVLSAVSTQVAPRATQNYTIAYASLVFLTAGRGAEHTKCRPALPVDRYPLSGCLSALSPLPGGRVQVPATHGDGLSFDSPGTQPQAQ